MAIYSHIMSKNLLRSEYLVILCCFLNIFWFLTVVQTKEDIISTWALAFFFTFILFLHFMDIMIKFNKKKFSS